MSPNGRRRAGDSPRTRPSRGLHLAARALGRARLFPALARSADRWRLLRGPRGRLRFPYVGIRHRRCFQVLLYHRVHDGASPYFPGVPVARFARQMHLLAEAWNVRPLAELVQDALRGDVPPRSVAITFDDGYEDNFTHAFPILQRWQLPATLFLATGPLDSGIPLWHDRVFDAFDEFGADLLVLEGERFPMRGFDGRERTLRRVLALLRARPPLERDRLVQAIVDQASPDRPAPPAPRMLNWEQVRAMSVGGVEFGAHTVTHPILSRMPLQSAVEEIVASRDAIERHVEPRVRLFAYPNGSREDFDGAIQRALRELGFLAATTTLWGSNDGTTDPFELRRVGLWDGDPEMLTPRLAWYRFSS